MDGDDSGSSRHAGRAALLGVHGQAQQNVVAVVTPPRSVWYAWSCCDEVCWINGGNELYVLAPRDMEPHCPKCDGDMAPHMPAVVHEALCHVDREGCDCALSRPPEEQA